MFFVLSPFAKEGGHNEAIREDTDKQHCFNENKKERSSKKIASLGICLKNIHIFAVNNKYYSFIVLHVI
jgi:hypothetical protein